MKRSWRVLIGGAFASALGIGATVGPASAATVTQRVIESTLKDGNRPNGDASDTSWYREDTHVGGGVTLTRDFGGPTGFGDGSVALTTNDQASAKAQLYTNQVNGTSLATITELSYWTRSSSAQAADDSIAAVASPAPGRSERPRGGGGLHDTHLCSPTSTRRCRPLRPTRGSSGTPRRATGTRPATSTAAPW